MMKLSINKIKTIILLLVIFTIRSPAVAEIYKWFDESGQTHFSATPPKNQKIFKDSTVKSSTGALEKKAPSKKAVLAEYKKKFKVLEQCDKALDRLPYLAKALESDRPFKNIKKFQSVIEKANLKVIFKNVKTCARNYENNKRIINCIADNDPFLALDCISSLDIFSRPIIHNTKANKQCSLAIGHDKLLILGIHEDLKEKLQQGEISDVEYKDRRRPLTSQLKLVESLSLTSCIDSYNSNVKSREFIDCYAGSLGFKSCKQYSKDINQLGITSKTLIEISKKY